MVFNNISYTHTALFASTLACLIQGTKPKWNKCRKEKKHKIVCPGNIAQTKRINKIVAKQRPPWFYYFPYMSSGTMSPSFNIDEVISNIYASNVPAVEGITLALSFRVWFIVASVFVHKGFVLDHGCLLDSVLEYQCVVSGMYDKNRS